MILIQKLFHMQKFYLYYYQHSQTTISALDEYGNILSNHPSSALFFFNPFSTQQSSYPFMAYHIMSLSCVRSSNGFLSGKKSKRPYPGCRANTISLCQSLSPPLPSWSYFHCAQVTRAVFPYLSIIHGLFMPYNLSLIGTSASNTLLPIFAS